MAFLSAYFCRQLLPCSPWDCAQNVFYRANNCGLCASVKSLSLRFRASLSWARRGLHACFRNPVVAGSIPP